MKKIISLICLSLSIIFMFSGCGIKPENIKPIPLKENITETKNEKNLDEFFSFLKDTKDENFVVSPLSYRYALSMLSFGIEDADKKQKLISFLGYKDENDMIKSLSLINDFAKDLENQQENLKHDFLDFEPSVLSISNSVWKSSLIKNDFKETYKNNISLFNAEYFSFTKDNVVNEVNKWAELKTNGLIKDFLPKDYIPDDIAVILMNALYLKSNWAENFSDPKQDIFTTNKNDKVTKNFITSVENYRYYSDKDTQLVICNLSYGIQAVFVIGNSDNLKEKINKAEFKKVRVKIPVIELDTKLDKKDINPFFQKSDVDFIFNPEISLKSMIDDEIHVDDIIQKTKFNLDEKGVEAAAVTAIIQKDTESIEKPEEPIDFIADKPFSFFICLPDKYNNEILFASNIVN